MADSAPTRDPASRLAIRASVLVMMLVSVSAHASARNINRGINEVSHSARVALQARLIADRLLPAQTEAGLARGIRFEIPRDPDALSASTPRIGSVAYAATPTPRLLRCELLNLPPPTR